MTRYLTYDDVFTEAPFPSRCIRARTLGAPRTWIHGRRRAGHARGARVPGDGGASAALSLRGFIPAAF
jgi:hypothetical protein